MDIDERLAKLTERHEALVLSLEILTHDVEGLKASSATLQQSIASLRDAARDSLQGQVRILQMVTSQTENIIAQQGNIDGLQRSSEALQRNSEALQRSSEVQQRNIEAQQRNIDSLLETARNHEKRLSRLENGHSSPTQ
jgi:hypothetical protein